MSRRWFARRLCLAALLLALLPIPRAHADGGVILSDPELWGWIEEGQQIAVVRLEEADTAHVDLFITMLDRTGHSHRVTFFVPLGVQAGDFNVVEQSSLDFDRQLTQALDDRLRAYARRQLEYKEWVALAIMGGTLLTNGLWSTVVILPFTTLVGGCALPMAPPPPLATFETPSSFISIYAIDQSTDLSGLIATAGLDPRVKDTLASLRGQQVAVINLDTQPAAQEQSPSYGRSSGQPGIHLAWTTALVRGPDGAAYTYPLGTGRAWATPIAMTRIYVLAPAGIDFAVDAPRLGDDLSGAESRRTWSGLPGDIYFRDDWAKKPAYAMDRAYDQAGQVWRAAYISSNSDRDVRITRLPETSAETAARLRQVRRQQVIPWITLVLALLAGAACWLVAWRWVMGGLLKIPYRWNERRLWQDVTGWSLLYPAVTLVAVITTGVSCFLLGIFLDRLLWGVYQDVATAITLALLLLILVMMSGGLNAALFARSKTVRSLEVTRRRAFFSYLLVVLAANSLYWIFFAGYTRLVAVL